MLAEHWYEWGDEHGDYRLAQPDIILVLPAGLICLIECKLTAKLEAWHQLRDLYGPLTLNEWPDYKHLHVVAAHNWRPCGVVADPRGDIEELLPHATRERPIPIYGWHWL